jgi:hypothetical protein
VRIVNERVSQCLMGDGYRYFMFWAGDELLLKAENDADAIKEGEELQKELDAAS